MLLSPNIKPASKPKTVQAFCRFPWEVQTDAELKEKAEACKISPAELNELNEIIKLLDKG